MMFQKQENKLTRPYHAASHIYRGYSITVIYTQKLRSSDSFRRSNRFKNAKLRLRLACAWLASKCTRLKVLFTTTSTCSYGVSAGKMHLIP